MFRKRYSPIGIDFNEDYLAAVQMKMEKGSAFLSNFAVISGADTLIPKGLKEKHFRGDTAVFTLNGSQVYLRSVTVPLLKKEELAEAVYWEMDKYLAGELWENPVVDYITVREKEEEGQPALEVLAAAVPRKKVEYHYELLARAGLKPVAMEFRQLSLCRILPYILKPAEAKECYLILEIRTNESSLLITDRKKVLFCRNIGLGTAALGTVTVNENPKRSFTVEDDAQGAARPDDPSLPEAFLHELERSIEYFLYHLQNRDKSLRFFLVTGQGECLQGLSAFLSAGLQLEPLPTKLYAAFPLQERLRKVMEVDLLPLLPVSMGLSLRGWA